MVYSTQNMFPNEGTRIINLYKFQMLTFCAFSARCRSKSHICSCYRFLTQIVKCQDNVSDKTM